MNLRTCSQEKAAVKVHSQLDEDSPSAAQKLFQDLLAFGVQLTPEEDLQSGHGDSVCFVINELLNHELLRQKYRFDPPRHADEASHEEFRELHPQSSDSEESEVSVDLA
jgi:hypothetical protein